MAVAIVIEAGGEILRQDRLASIGVSMAVLDLKRQIAADDLRRVLQERGVKVTLSRNSTYQMAEGARVYAGAMVGVDIAKPCPLTTPVTIGLVDGPVDKGSSALVGVEILAHSVLSEGERPATADHATALAGLIASPGDGTFPPGLASGAKLLSAVAFASRNGRNLAQMDRIAAALDWLAGQGAGIINLSLTGPPNDTLAYILRNFADSGLILIASVGNEGTDQVSFPASDPNVLGVSAIDAAGRLYPQANKGPEVDFVAPGVDLLVDEGERRTYRSGTSYASAVATGVVAQLFARQRGSAADIVAHLRASAKDMGTSGFDSRFGWGLLQLAGCPD
ncbi:MAG TPA: S8 family serine peptidase [Paracoccaceae bacterium]|nr:S8 family serine peptidase [Paracoccaceae bacterium]